jgi:hypothetical protein
MRFGGEMNYDPDAFLTQYALYQRRVAYVAMDKAKAGMRVNIDETR